MHIKSIVAGAVIAIAASVGSASALEGIVAAIAFTPRLLGSPQGEHSFLSERDFPQIIVDLGKPPGGFTTMPTIDRNFCHIVAHGGIGQQRFTINGCGL